MAGISIASPEMVNPIIGKFAEYSLERVAEYRISYRE
jgi:hypothetical protein